MSGTPFIYAIVIVILGMCPGSSQDQPSACDSSHIELAGGCFTFHGTKMNWYDARDHCQSMSDDGATVDLATVRNCQQASLIWEYIVREYGRAWHWLGGSQGKWMWVTGEEMPLGHPYWFPGHPSGYPEGNCLALHDVTGYFYSHSCGHVGPFVCQHF